MKIPFEYKYNLIMVKVDIGIKVGGEALLLNCLLDTGSDKTIITPPYIKALGLSEKDKIKDLTVSGGGGNDKGYLIELPEITCLGSIWAKPKVVVKGFHMGLYFLEGIVGLDFFQAIQKKLVIDFVKKEIEILDSEAH
jgi:hypothetical protein